MFTRMNLISIEPAVLWAGPRVSPAGRYILLPELRRVHTPESLLLVQYNSLFQEAMREAISIHYVT